MSAWVTPDFEAASAVKRGEQTLPLEFTRFADDFEQRFHVAPLYVSVDSVRPIVHVCLERESSVREFKQGGERFGNFIPSRQRLAGQLFARAIGARRRVRWLVTFWAFESDAIQAAHAGVSKADLRHWSATLGLGAELWTVETNGWAAPVVFTQTDKQAARYRDSPEMRRWAESYLELARPHDEYGYLTVEHCVVRVDSKESFDTTYASNWFYYWR